MRSSLGKPFHSGVDLEVAVVECGQNLLILFGRRARSRRRIRPLVTLSCRRQVHPAQGLPAPLGWPGQSGADRHTSAGALDHAQKLFQETFGCSLILMSAGQIALQRVEAGPINMLDVPASINDS